MEMGCRAFERYELKNEMMGYMTKSNGNEWKPYFYGLRKVRKPYF